MSFMPEKRTASKFLDPFGTSPARKKARMEDDSKKSALVSQQNPHHKYGHSVQLLVGADKEAFIVHEATLKAAAPFFDVALTRDWEERQTKTLELLEDEPCVIEAFIDWAYTGSITVLPPNADSVSPPVVGLCIKLYIFANKDAIYDGRITNEAFNARNSASSHSFTATGRKRAMVAGRGTVQVLCHKIFKLGSLVVSLKY
ncbi:hypothetical protein BDZ85DRAFT_281691 [Elsinoe ampelina]|uniref:BTB domain-containing protein n=1 Tax=Elsinoe ampelina TaxID=302913 RepID=A0A6A6GE34_9PEZI|nr:hypothetical protein BDZ85DRAFT_281691 [Elsinoe ampelina]